MAEHTPAMYEALQEAVHQLRNAVKHHRGKARSKLPGDRTSADFHEEVASNYEDTLRRCEDALAQVEGQ